MRIDGIGFNPAIPDMYTEKQFVDAHQHLSPEGRKVVKNEWLKEVYRILKANKSSRRTRAQK